MEFVEELYRPISPPDNTKQAAKQVKRSVKTTKQPAARKGGK